MPYLTVDDHHPLLIVRRIGVADAASVTSMLAWVEQRMSAADRKLGYVYDAGETPGGVPDAHARRAAGEWLRTHRGLLQRKCVGLDFALPSPLSRGALTALFWIAPPAIPHGLHGSLREAVEASLARLVPPSKLDAAAIVRDLGRRPSV